MIRWRWLWAWWGWDMASDAFGFGLMLQPRLELALPGHLVPHAMGVRVTLFTGLDAAERRFAWFARHVRVRFSGEPWPVRYEGETDHAVRRRANGYSD